MARMNARYGSEFHLLRMLGRHRDFFNKKVLGVTGAYAIEWCDFPSGEIRRDKKGNIIGWDREWEHLGFMPDGDPARTAWDTAWPTHRTGHNWDAIGRLSYRGSSEWLLVEAKANIEELRSNCGAKDQRSLDVIRDTLNRTKSALGVPENCDWIKSYYQFCNRVAALNFMNAIGSPARMLFVYFCGDVSDGHRTCPSSEAGWRAALTKLDAYVGLATNHRLHDRIHKLFVDVECVC
jgi:hypothetical protein